MGIFRSIGKFFRPKEGYTDLTSDGEDKIDTVENSHGPFGYSESNPIPVARSSGQIEYLSKLRCACNQPFDFHRVGSVGSGPDGHLIDEYELTCKTGKHTIVLYMDMYHSGPSNLIPEGLTKAEPGEIEPRQELPINSGLDHKMTEREDQIDLRQLLKREFDIDYPISGGISNSVDNPIVIHKQDHNDYPEVQTEIISRFGLGKGVEWDVIRLKVFNYNDRTLNQLIIETNETTENDRYSQTASYYFDITEFEPPSAGDGAWIWEPPVQNSEWIEPNVFSVLGLVKLWLPTPSKQWWWRNKDLKNENSKGAIFEGYIEEEPQGAYILVADATNDPDEPDISTLEQCDVAKVDKYLEEDLRESFAAIGDEIIKWMSSHLKESENGKGLTSAYIAREAGRDSQFMAVRHNVKGRKLVVIGCFDIVKKEILAPTIFNAIGEMVVIGTGDIVHKENNVGQTTELVPIDKIVSKEPPRQMLAEDFKSSGGELPIRGGWGYTKEDACIIDKNDPLVDPDLPFDGIGIEYIFVEKRIYEEMIIFRPEGDKFSGIRWDRLKQQLIDDGDRVFDKLVFEITAFPDKDWDELKAEYEGPHGYGNPNFDLAAHEKKRQEKMIRFTREFWFDITSFYGQGVVITDKRNGEKELLPPESFRLTDKFKKLFEED